MAVQSAPDIGSPETLGPSYLLHSDDSVTIEHYDSAPPFSSFLPGIAGPLGVPLWCMYVNRGQAIVSLGVGGKDNAIMEFLPATWAYQMAGLQGFRTFCKIDGAFYEPFQPQRDLERAAPIRTLRVETHAATVSESGAHDLTFSVRYFSPSGQKVGSLFRRLTITNTGTTPRRVELLDGLPVILPSGVTDWMMKKIRRLTEAYSSARLLAGHTALYSLRVTAHDSAEVVPVTGANFYAAWAAVRGQLRPLVPIVDPDIVFGEGVSLEIPRRFVAQDSLDVDGQVWENRLPCALVPYNATLGAGESLDLYAAVGFASSETLARSFVESVTSAEYVAAMESATRSVVEAVSRPAFTASSIPELDAYARQNFVDNVLRGGEPWELPSATGPALLYIYMRRHGDLERDYNDFQLAPHPLSTGPGNYRDILQNRRFNSWFYPEVLDSELPFFAGLIQPDGYNPLVVEGHKWVFGSGSGELGDLWPTDDEGLREEFIKLLREPFSPGQLLAWIDRRGIEIADPVGWLRSVLALCRAEVHAHGHEGGFWIDHWTYLTDMLEAYSAVYPDRIADVLAKPSTVGWFTEGAFVRPRREKTMLRPTGPLQMNCVAEPQTAPGDALSAVSLLGKLCAIVAVKSVSFDYNGCGIEMEAGRPGWNDALNGLPGLFGSSTCEAAELARLAGWLRTTLSEIPDVTLPAQVADLIEAVVLDLEAPDYDWNRSCAIRERFRAGARDGFAGETRAIGGHFLARLLEGAEQRALKGVKQAVSEPSGLVHTYYRQDPETVSPQVSTDGSPRFDPETGSQLLSITKFTPVPLPLFLEGQVHLLRLTRTTEEARRIYRSVRNSQLLDDQLTMYKLNEPLTACNPEIGRARTFSRGWYENESIWLHMSYKYLLELLRSGLHAEFFEDAKTMLVPFMNPKVYGRSVLENCSFIASSACPDAKARGRGFVARLSGTTAEFIHIWTLITAGQKPFEVTNGQLKFALQPVLPGSWFLAEERTVTWNGTEVRLPAGCFGCAFLGSILLVYHNPKRRDTFGPGAVSPRKYVLTDGLTLDADSVVGEVASMIRDRRHSRIDVMLD